jgi:hypothetical protein
LISLPDVNVLLALCWKQHIHHEAAHEWFGAASPGGWATCTMTQGSFVRLSLNPKIVHVSLSCEAARDLLKQLIAHPLHRFVSHLPPIADDAFAAIGSLVSGYQQIPDATLLYVARVNGMKLVTFDQSAKAVCPWPQHIEILSR